MKKTVKATIRPVAAWNSALTRAAMPKPAKFLFSEDERMLLADNAQSELAARAAEEIQDGFDELFGMGTLAFSDTQLFEVKKNLKNCGKNSEGQYKSQKCQFFKKNT